MKIKKTEIQGTWKDGNPITILIDSRLNFTNYNIISLAHYINKRDYMINSYYQDLLPSKIYNLKIVKKQLLETKIYYQKIIKDNPTKENFYKQTQILPLLKKKAKQSIYIEIVFNLLQSKGLLIDGLSDQQKADISQYFQNCNIIEGLKHTIAFIDKRIKFYQSQARNKARYKPLSITGWDLSQLKKGQITDAIKRLSYYYLMKIKKARISDKAIKTYAEYKPFIDQYFNTDVYNDFSEYIKEDLKAFEKDFLTKIL